MVRALHARGRLGRVYADETRPLLQGARLTAWELGRMGVDYRVVVDGAGPSLIARGLVDAVVVGADRVAANGDVANKIGTYPLALAAARAGVPFVVVGAGVDRRRGHAGRRRHRDRGPGRATRCSRRRPAAGARRRPGGQPGLRRDAGRSGHRHRHRAPRGPARGGERL